MVLSPPGGTVGFRRGMSLRDSLRRVGSKIRQSAGRNRKCRPAVEPTGGQDVAPTVKKCRLEYKRLASVSEQSPGADRGWEERCVDFVRNEYEVVRNGAEIARNRLESEINCYEVVRNGSESLRNSSETARNCYEVVSNGSESVRNSSETTRNCYEVVSNGSESVRNSSETTRNCYEVVSNGSESLRNSSETARNCYEVVSNGSESVRNSSETTRNCYEVVRNGSESARNCFEVVRNTDERVAEDNKYEVVRETENRYPDVRNEYEVIRSEVRSPLRPLNNYEVLRKDRRRSSLPRVDPKNCVVAKKEKRNAGDNVFGPAANEYEVLRSVKKNKGILVDTRNNYEVIRKESREKAKTYFSGKDNCKKSDYGYVKKYKKKKRRASVGNYDKFCYENNCHINGDGNVAREGLSGNDLVDEFLNQPENRGTLNPAFEDFTLKSNLAPAKKNSRVPFQELTLPLDDDSFKENVDPLSVTVKRKKKYSVRFDIQEEVEGEVTARKFGNVIFEESQRRPSILKGSRRFLEEENDSTEELLIRNYELLTKDGSTIREESNTSKFVRRRFEEVNQEEREFSSEEESEGLPLPVVSLYHAPEDRMPSRRKKKAKRPQEEALEQKTASSDLRVISISTVDSLNQPATLRTDRLAKIVQKFGPEVLLAMGEDGGDSVLAQFKKSLERPREDVVVVKPEDKEDTVKENVEEESRRRGRKRKHVEDIYDPGPAEGLMEVLGRAASRKKLPHIDIHLHALFAAVEHGHVEKARTILESTDVDVNSVNSDGLTPLDVAVLSNNRSLTKVLIAFGAREGNKFGSPEKLLAHLRQLACEAERRVGELGGGGGDEGPRSAPPYSGTTAPASEKTLALWERRSKGLNKMITGFEQARPPDVPFLVAVDVTGTNSVTVRFQEPEHSDSPPCTKFRVEWSTEADFLTVAGHREILDMKQTEVTVDGLTHGQCYHFRAACGNIRGYSQFRPSQPDCVIPSSWRDVTGREERLPPAGLALLDRLFAEVRSGRPDLKGLGDPGPGETPVGQRRKKTTIKQLFTAASKFQKHLKRGVFLSCLLYHEDRVLVTNEDFLPVIEVDETYPGSIYHDFHWLLKVACTWDDVKWLRQDMEKSLSSSAVHFRIKLLQAAAQMQTALSIQDLGQLYHKPLRDSEGTIVICTVNYTHSPKSISVLNSRWLPLGKLSKRAPPAPDANISEILMSTIQDQITYHQVSSIRLPRGLYLAYLKMRSCVDLLQVLVPAKSPNVPPHCKIRDNSHVTAEEWRALVGGAVSEHQKSFVEQVAATARRLFTYMEVTTEDASVHRLYDLETVEISPEVSLLMVVPPVDSACSVPGQRETLLQRADLLPLPVQVFEMVHLGTYRHQVVSRYSRLSCIIELDMALAQHSQREAFSSSELTVAKERLARLEALQAQLNTAWKQSRWLLDVLAFARDRLSHSPTCMRHLLAYNTKRSREHMDTQNGLLQPPDPKAVKSRGSWPGPGTGRLLGTVTAELSRSEQHLSNSSGQGSPPPLPPPRPDPPTPPQTDPVRLPPSRSEDTLVLSRNSHATRARCSVSATTSPLLHSRPQYGSGSLHSLSSDDSAVANHSKSEGEGEEEGATVPAPAPGILQVYAAYDTGLAAGTSLKLHVSPRTSAREVVDLVVKQLNMAVVLKGKDGPIYPADQLGNFCLVAVIGARERCLRDDFKPLQLQNPWKKGRLYVRQKHDVLAALEHSSRHSAFL